MNFDPAKRKHMYSIYKAIIDSDIEYLRQNLIVPNLIDLKCEFSDFSDIPSILKSEPPVISVAAYYDKKDVFDYLFMNGASITEEDRVSNSIIFNYIFNLRFKMEFQSILF